MTKQDMEYLRGLLAPELATYLSHQMVGTKLSEHEQARLDFLRGVHGRLEAAILAVS